MTIISFNNETKSDKLENLSIWNNHGDKDSQKY